MLGRWGASVVGNEVASDERSVESVVRGGSAAGAWPFAVPFKRGWAGSAGVGARAEVEGRAIEDGPAVAVDCEPNEVEYAAGSAV